MSLLGISECFKLFPLNGSFWPNGSFIAISGVPLIKDWGWEAYGYFCFKKESGFLIWLFKFRPAISYSSLSTITSSSGTSRSARAFAASFRASNSSWDTCTPSIALHLAALLRDTITYSSNSKFRDASCWAKRAGLIVLTFPILSAIFSPDVMISWD